MRVATDLLSLPNIPGCEITRVRGGNASWVIPFFLFSLICSAYIDFFHACSLLG